MRGRESATGAVVGLLSAGVAVAVGEIAAVFVRPVASPVIAVGNRVITLTPEPVKQWAIRNFGTGDKTFLLTSIYLVIAVGSAALGMVAMRRPRVAVAGIAAFGLVAAWCAWTTNGAAYPDGVPALIGAAIGAAVLARLCTLAVAAEPAAASSDTDGPQRRTFLVASAAAAGFAAFGIPIGRFAQGRRFDASGARAQLTLPRPSAAAPALPDDADLGRSGNPFVTPNADFYRIDTALHVPQIDPDAWSLRIHGMVDRDITLTYADLLARPLIERWVTLMCVSNEVGGDLIGNARFLGARLADLLRDAGVHAGADQLVARSADGMTIGSPTAVVMDGRDAMLAVGMNGEPLPISHGFPVRMVVPGLYGYVSACKWIVDLEATTFDRREAYWVQRGWAAQAPIRIGSRIDVPEAGRTRVTAGGVTPLAGVAWAQHTGISAVEVKVDGPSAFDWTPARLGGVPSTDTWRQWLLPWTPTAAGEHRVTVRAVDAEGNRQDEKRRRPAPSGATGLHTVTVFVR